MSLSRIKVKHHKGMRGVAKATKKAPYRVIERSPEMFSFGKDSHFIAPQDNEHREACETGVRR